MNLSNCRLDSSHPYLSRGRALQVYLVEDDAEIREPINLLLSKAGYTVGQFSNAEAFLETKPAANSGCMVLDLDLGATSGLELQRLLREQLVSLPTLVITGSNRVSSVVDSFKLGAIDVLTKPFKMEELLEGVERLFEQLANQLRIASERHDAETRLARLSEREREVMVRLASNHSTKQIAADLKISPKTVDVHRSRIMAKTSSDSVVELVHLAFRAGILK